MHTKHSYHHSLEKGYTTLAIVSSVAMLVITMLSYNLLTSLRSIDAQSKAQTKQDYTQKENAILSALTTIVPNRAIGAMKAGSAANPDHYSWEAIFRTSLDMAQAEQSVKIELLNALNLTNAISSNPSDTSYVKAHDFVKAPVPAQLGDSSLVNAGNTWEHAMLSDLTIGPRVPAALYLSYEDSLLDRIYPIVSPKKTYVSTYTKGLGLSPNDFPRYNLLQYPNIRFALKKPGEQFVAKRNWWVFSLTFGAHNEAQTGIPTVKKDYMLSIYEIPSQVPLSASALLKVGKFADGTAWQNVTLNGTIAAEHLQTEGNVAVMDGMITATKSLNLSRQTTVNGVAVDPNFDALGAREERSRHNEGNSATSEVDFYYASVGGNVGKVAFIPINRGNETFDDTSDGDRSQRVSPTGWNEYSQAGAQTAMKVEILSVKNVNSQIPLSIRLTYRTGSGGTSNIVYTRGSNWPSDTDPNGSSFPFQTDALDTGRQVLVVHLDRLPQFVNNLPNSGGISKNNSLHVLPTRMGSSVPIPQIPSQSTDMAVSLRGGQDLTAYTSGFSLVSKYRVHIAETLNNVAGTRPLNAGLPEGEVFYPPLSIFAPETRYGESQQVAHNVRLKGQIHNLKAGDGDTVNPLELRGANEQRIQGNKINANLTGIKSPAELPPVHLMNWLVTVEPIN